MAQNDIVKRLLPDRMFRLIKNNLSANYDNNKGKQILFIFLPCFNKISII